MGGQRVRGANEIQSAPVLAFEKWPVARSNPKAGNAGHWIFIFIFAIFRRFEFEAVE
jgi:hypothetical protein